MLTTTVQYGIIIVKALKHSESLMSAGQLAKTHELSPTFTDQIIRKLRNAGIVTSLRGPGGGYRLVRFDVTLLELVELLSANHEIHDSAINIYSECTLALSAIKV